MLYVLTACEMEKGKQKQHIGQGDEECVTQNIHSTKTLTHVMVFSVKIIGIEVCEILWE